MRRPLLPVLVLCLATLGVFLPLLNAHFLLWDDNTNVYLNPWYQPLSLENTARFWTESYNHTYRPLVHTAWALIAWASYSTTPLHIPGGGETNFDGRVFHCVNVLLHLLNVLLVWRLARLWVKNEWCAVGGALLFALHPLQVESVGWVTGFNELLCATFCLGSTWCYCRFAIGDSGQARRLYIGAVVFYGLALLTKPAAVALPLVLWVLDHFIIGRSAGQATRSLAPWLAAGLGWSIVTALAHPDDYAGVPPPLFVRPFLAGDALAWYAEKFFLPFPLAADTGRTPAVVMKESAFWLRWTVPLFLLAPSWTRRRRIPWFLAAVLGSFLWLLPVAGLKPFHFQLVYSMVADRYMYFALAIVALAVASGLEDIYETGVPIGYFYVPLVLVWAGLSSVQTRTWVDNFSFFQHILAVNPRSWMANANLAQAYNGEGQPGKAIPYVRAALQIDPTRWEFHIMLARYSLAVGRVHAARENYAAALKLNPGNAEAMQYLSGGKPTSPSSR
jgi:hypothetical protein